MKKNLIKKIGQGSFTKIKIESDLNSLRCPRCGSSLVAIIENGNNFEIGHEKEEHEITCSSQTCSWSLIDMTNVRFD